MKTLILTIATILTLTGVAFAGSRWQGPGWYQIVEKLTPGIDSIRVIYIPQAFPSRDECLKTLLPDRHRSGLDEHSMDTYYDFSCVELPARPMWDH